MSKQLVHGSHKGSLVSTDWSHEHAPGEPSEALETSNEKAHQDLVHDTDSTGKKKLGCCEGCRCVHLGRPVIEVAEAEKLLAQKKDELTAKFNVDIRKQFDALKERAEFILQNEQVRASYMLREAHRERQEKIGALQTQLECKNLAALMYVMCMERNRSKREKMAIIEQYTSYILELQEILVEAQDLILNLSKGYKTAARVNQEWRQKMSKTIMEFQMFVHDFAKGTPESDQYFFDLPELLKTETPIVDDPNEDPCTCDEDEPKRDEICASPEPEKPWFERLDGKRYPFVVFGDMADFKPPQRREVLTATKKIKSIPKKWKEYVFNDMYVLKECTNADVIQDLYTARVPPSPAWECQRQPQDLVSRQSTQVNSPNGVPRRGPAVSIDARGGMGSILKIITTSANVPAPVTPNKATLLGARDSMEIFSTTKVRDKLRRGNPVNNNVILDIGKRRTSLFPEDELDEDEIVESSVPRISEQNTSKNISTLEEYVDESRSMLGSVHIDSLTVMTARRPDVDHKIHYEKICPMEKCQRLGVDTFMSSLPSYMRASPFTHFHQNYENYEVCSPEQLLILKQRIEIKKKKERADNEKLEESPLDEWKAGAEGVSVQTSEPSLSLPPCTCRVGPAPTPTNSDGHIFNVTDLLPMKQVLNHINHKLFYDNNIEFNRFKVIGEESSVRAQKSRDEKFKTPPQNKLSEVTKVLKQHPSLLDIFQGNAV